MKKSCDKCKASNYMNSYAILLGEQQKCDLGYKTNGKEVPLEECPKPLSWKKYHQLLNEK